ncbi:unnamed protein product [Dibothriocephalus latus]|uniref:Uncharacterized protein n=1 Tax=Dibothriocephalus latus TaxID=60516 RepID=A0A3P6Q1T7_DIBLA|nr:unnamed protein product [Dibothriocephalus latus]
MLNSPLHSAGLLTETDAKMPLQLFLKQGNPRTVLQVHFILHGLLQLLTCDRAGVAMAHSLFNFFHGLDLDELFLLQHDSNAVSDKRILRTNFLEQVVVRLELADILLQVLILSGQHLERAQLDYPTEGSHRSPFDHIETGGLADCDKRLLSTSNPLISATVKVCSQLIRLCDTAKENSLKSLIHKVSF